MKAVQTYQAALQLYARRRDDDGEIGTLKNIGIVNALDLGDLDEAQKYFEKAFELARKSKNRREEMQAHLYRGEVFVRKGEWSRAKQEFQTALSASQALRQPKNNGRLGMDSVASRNSGACRKQRNQIIAKP